MEISRVSSLLDLQKQVATESADTAGTKDFEAILSEAMAKKDDTELKEACDELESYMLSMMFKQMKSSMLSGDSLIAKGDYESMFEDTYINNLCDEMVKAGGIGLSDAMYKQMTNTYVAQMQISDENKAAMANEAIKTEEEV